MTYREVVVPAKPKPVEVPLDLRAAGKIIEKHKASDADDIFDAMTRSADTISEAAGNVKIASERILANQMKTPIENAAAAKKRVKEIYDSAASKLTATRDKVDAAIAKLEQQTLPAPPKDMLGAVSAIQGMEIRTMLRHDEAGRPAQGGGRPWSLVTPVL